MSFPRIARILPLALLAAFAPAQDRGANSTPIPTFKTGTRIVVVDVVATDNDGKPVHDLKPGDFTLLDEGKQQGIVSFDEQRSDANPDPSIALKLPESVYTNYVSRKEPGALTVLLFDSLNTNKADLPNARKKMLSFLKDLPAGQRVALYTLGSQLRMVQSFTDNTDQLIAAAKLVSTHQHLSYTTAADVSAAVGSLKESAISTTPAFGHIVQFLGEEYEGKTEARTQSTLDALTQLAHALAIVPGRKNLIWISEGLPFDISSNDSDMQKVAALLAATRIAVYPVDVRGVVLTGPDAQTQDSAIFSQNQSYETLSGSDRESQNIIATMQNIARLTGGRATINNNDLEGAIAESMQNGSNYYSVAYRPTGADWNGKFHRLTLKTSRPNVKLLYRSGYYATPDNLKDDPDRIAALAMQPTVPASTQLIVKARIIPPKANDATGVNMLIDPHDLALTQENGDEIPDVQFIGVAWDASGKQSASFSVIFHSPLTAAQYESLARTGMQVNRELILKPGSYQLRVGVLDRISGRIGTLDVPVTIRTKVATK